MTDSAIKIAALEKKKGKETVSLHSGSHIVWCGIMSTKYGLFTEPSYITIGDPYNAAREPNLKATRLKGVNMKACKFSTGKQNDATFETFKPLYEIEKYEKTWNERLQSIQKVSSSNQHDMMPLCEHMLATIDDVYKIDSDRDCLSNAIVLTQCCFRLFLNGACVIVMCMSCRSEQVSSLRIHGSHQVLKRKVLVKAITLVALGTCSLTRQRSSTASRRRAMSVMSRGTSQRIQARRERMEAWA